ncbi:MAG: ABC transporter permease, partial [Candidatus Bathyarchaeia archaeon]
RDVVQVKPFELMVALRYLTAKRKQAVIAVISLIGVLGITAGVAVLVIALALVNGFNQDIQGKLLEGTAHLNLLRKDGQGIENVHELRQKITIIPGIRAIAPTSYEGVYIFSAGRASGIIVKGVDLNAPREANEVWTTILEGRVESLATGDDEVNGIILGKVIAEELAEKAGEVEDLRIRAGLSDERDRSKDIEQLKMLNAEALDKMRDDLLAVVTMIESEPAGPKARFRVPRSDSLVEQIRETLYGYTRDDKGEVN